MPNTLTGSKRLEVADLMNSSVILSEYDEDSQREYFSSLAHMYKDAKVGDEKFKEICQGRAEGPAAAGHLFSTCGEWAQFLLERAGYRGPVLNRDLWYAGQKSQAWQSGKNIEYLFSRARKAGAFSEYLLSKQKSKRPQCGDICYIAVQGKSSTEHVFMFEGLDSATGIYERWTSFDGGQGGVNGQHIAECHRVFDTRNGMLYGMSPGGVLLPHGEGRPLIGWVNIALLEFSEPANLRVWTA